MSARLRVTLRWRGIALLRALYWRHLRRWQTEICHNCGRPVRVVWWTYDDALWETVTGESHGGGIRCIPCFDEAARAHCAWIEWVPGNLRHMTMEGR